MAYKYVNTFHLTMYTVSEHTVMGPVAVGVAVKEIYQFSTSISMILVQDNDYIHFEYTRIYLRAQWFSTCTRIPLLLRR
jgi:hypothetical protein